MTLPRANLRSSFLEQHIDFCYRLHAKHFSSRISCIWHFENVWQALNNRLAPSTYPPTNAMTEQYFRNDIIFIKQLVDSSGNSRCVMKRISTQSHKSRAKLHPKCIHYSGYNRTATIVLYLQRGFALLFTTVSREFPPLSQVENAFHAKRIIIELKHIHAIPMHSKRLNTFCTFWA